MKVVTDKQRIDTIFNRGIVVEVLPSKEEFFKRLLSGERLRIYIGADPTSNALHLSHAKNYMFLEELRQLGHETIILFGDFTAQIGDPTNRNEARPELTEKQIKENVAGWISQIKPLMDFDDKKNPPRILYNSTWLAKLSLKNAIALAHQFTVQQMLERDMFEKRWKGNIPIYLHEFLYPVMQGYDSVAMDVDVELCGTDQTFNALAGRTLLRRLKNKEKFVVALNLMANPKTGELMSKSKGTGVFLSAPPNEMFGAIMAQPDEMIEVLFVNCTRIPLEEKDSIMALGPRNAKARVALEIVKKFYGEEGARRAERVFERTFREGIVPEDVPDIKLKKGDTLVEKLVKGGVISSKAEWRRLIRGGAVRDEKNTKIADPSFTPRRTTVLKIGKRRFIKVIVP
ncbi:MAG: tyrosine--tRNA ligase [Parcubacteria group bacterium RIFCSPLOWO2_01_FULL_48_18]|nr:MAG: tyrosine--tRNA ligase [Parcubacteria group bacterium RIFCSPLOWO2_01_FULL_48_18]OHB23264.1 MAG: tyrosine--tRNA ligase [Parcubacteria group bacterium RIFCSPHIGHO2_02_FULL_48_10b]